MNQYELFKDINNRCNIALKQQVSNEYYQYSELWAGIFGERQKSPEIFSDLLVFQNENNQFTNGISERRMTAQAKELFIEYYKDLIDLQLIKQFPISFVGSPTVIDLNGMPVSPSYLNNLRLFSEVREHIKSNFTNKIDVLEIGAGYGGLAYFLIKSGLVNSYTIIDLPENLRMSAFYLTQNFPDMAHEFPCNSAPLTKTVKNSINFLTPGNISALECCKFNFAINTDSLGEMPAHAAKSYIKWINDHLCNDGLFYSKNGFNRGHDTVKSVQEYGFDAYVLRDIKPSPVISTVWDDFSQCLLLGKSGVPMGKIYVDYLAVLARLYAVGLGDELHDFTEALKTHSLTSEQEFFLSQCAAYFNEHDLNAKIKNMEQLNNSPYFYCASYLMLLAEYVGKKKPSKDLLVNYRENTKSYITEAYIKMIYKDLNSKRLFGNKSKYALNEIEKIYKMPLLLRNIILNLRREVLRKKINNSDIYRPSFLIKFKNLLFNFKEKRVLSFHR